MHNKSKNIILPIPYRQGPYGQGQCNSYKYITGQLGGDQFENELNSLKQNTQILDPVKWKSLPNDMPKIGSHARSYMDLQQNTIQKFEEFYSQDTKLTVLGGDHSISSAIGPALSYYRDLSKTLLVWVDAHGDSNTPKTSMSGSITGYPVALHHGLGSLELLQKYQNFVSKTVFIGLRDVDQKEIKNIQKMKSTVYSILDVLHMGIHTILNEIQELSKSFEKIWLSIDVDVLDPVYFGPEETDVPRPFGLTPNDLLLIVFGLSQNPKLDVLEITQLNDMHKKTDLSFMVQRLIEVYYHLASYRFGKTLT